MLNFLLLKAVKKELSNISIFTFYLMGEVSMTYWTWDNFFRIYVL